MSTYLKVLLLIIGVFLLRPSALGQGYTSLGLIVISVAFFVHLLEILRSRAREKQITKKNLIILLSSLVLWGYFLLHGLIVGSNRMDFVLKASVAHIVVIVCMAIMLSSEKTNYYFFRWFVKVLLFFSFSYLITFVAIMLLGIDAGSLVAFNIPIEGYERSGAIYFPFTQLYGFMSVGDIKLPRVSGFFREAGIFQCFLIWAFFNLKQYGLDSKFNKFLLFVGIIGTFSTAGIAILIGVYAVKLFLNKRKFMSVLIVISSFLVLIFTPYIGLQAKTETHGDSISDRSFATSNGLERFKENPIGTGLYNAEVGDYKNSGINLLASSYMIGFLGLILTIIVYVFPMYKYPYKKKYFISILPFFITLLISQPILDAPVIYVMMMAFYGEVNYGVVKNKTKVKKIRLFKKIQFKRYRITW